MKVFFICCVIFLVLAWLFISAEHGDAAGSSFLDFMEKFFGEDEDE